MTREQAISIYASGMSENDIHCIFNHFEEELNKWKESVQKLSSHICNMDSNKENRKFSRVEVINSNGRVFVDRSDYTMSVQDEGRTLKLFGVSKEIGKCSVCGHYNHPDVSLCNCLNKTLN